MPVVGVIIPAYNAGAFLAETLNSVVRQTLSDWMCVVVDDGSSDDTRAIAERHAEMDTRIKVSVVPNGGQAAARNHGITLLPIDIPYVIFLDADDVWEDTALATLFATLHPRPDASAAAVLLHEIAEGGRLLISDDAAALHSSASGYTRRGICGWRLVRWPDEDPTCLATLAVQLHIKTPGQVLIRTAALRNAGQFDGFVSPSEDWDFLLRLALEGPILHVPVMLLRKRRVAGSQSLQPSLMRRAEPRLRKTWAIRPGLTKAQRHTLRLGHFYGATMRFAWAGEALKQGRPVEAGRHAGRGAKAILRWAWIEGRATVALRADAGSGTNIMRTGR